MNEYEQSRGIGYYQSEGRIEEFQVSTDMTTPRQESNSALVVKADEEIFALESEPTAKNFL